MYLYPCVTYLARKPNFSAPYYVVIRGLSYCTVFVTLSHKWHDFRKKIIEHKMRVLIFSTTFVCNIFYNNNSARYYHKFTQVFV
jgi:hypothetical protein